MSVATELGFVGINAVLVAAILALAYVILKPRVEQAIRAEYDTALQGLQHEFDRQLEIFRFEQRRRERGAMIAELFAEWASKPTDKKRLNQLAWEASLWLPAEIIPDLTKRLCNAPDAKDLKQLLVDVRRHLVGKDDGVDWRDIVHF